MSRTPAWFSPAAERERETVNSLCFIPSPATSRQTQGPTDWRRFKDRNRKTENHRQRQPETENHRQRQPETENHRQRQPETENHRQRQPETENHRQRQPETENYRQRQPETENHRQRQPETENYRQRQPETDSWDDRDNATCPAPQWKSTQNVDRRPSMQEAAAKRIGVPGYPVASIKGPITRLTRK